MLYEVITEHQQLARPHVGRDLGVVDRLLGGIGDEQDDDIGRLRGLGHALDAESYNFV